MPSPIRVVAAAAVVLAAASACSVAGPDAGDASTVVTAFTSALSHQDGDRACSLLAPATRESLEEESGSECRAAITGLDLPIAGSTSDARSYGRQAQVRTADDVVFLARSGTTWLITAAGCTAREDRPYDCSLEGS